MGYNASKVISDFRGFDTNLFLQFFLAVVPACLVFISYSAWLSTHYTDVLTHAVLLEFSLFGMQWIYSA